MEIKSELNPWAMPLILLDPGRDTGEDRHVYARPVLMDIRLQGKMDGTETAVCIRKNTTSYYLSYCAHG